MNHHRLLALEIQRLSNTYALGSAAALGFAIGGGHYSEALKLLASGLSIGLAWMGLEHAEIAAKLRARAREADDLQENLERVEQALQFAQAKTELEERYGLFDSPPLVSTPDPQAKQSQAPESQTRQPPTGEDFVFAQLAPDAEEAIKDWLNLDFYASSKVICAASGAGKSTYLQREYREVCRDRTTYLIDPHLPLHHMEGFVWTESKEQDQRIVCQNEYQINRVLTDLIEEVKGRLKGERVLSPTHVIIDEADGNVFRGDTIRPKFQEFVCLIANEARKTKVTLSFVVHSIQKQKTGLDASDLTQIRWLIMGNALSTPYSRWPMELDPAKWRGLQADLQSTIDLDAGRVCVLYQPTGISLEVFVK